MPISFRMGFGSEVIGLIASGSLPTTPLVTCLLGALDGSYPESLSTGWFVHYLDTRVRQ